MSASSSRIRRARPDDLSALSVLEHNSFRGDRLSPRRLRYWLTAGNAILLVAVAGSDVLGYSLALTRRDSRAARLYSIAIAASARGQGLGARLLARTERECRKLGSNALRLEVARGNGAAIGLYDSRGYRVFDTRPAYYEDGQDALRMEKKLEP